MMDEREIERLRSLGLTDEAIRSEAERRQRGQLGDSMPDDGGQSAESQQATPGGAERGRGGSAYPVTLNIEYPERLNRWLIFVKWLLAIPNVIVLMVLALAYYVTLIIAWFAILFTARYPKGLFGFAVGVMRWNLRATAYMYFLRDEYPPFSLS